jgi:transcription termination/antitermination protein NusG
MRELCPEINGAGDPARWFALTVKHQHERRVEGVLCANGVQTFLPVFRSRRQWSDRIKQQDAPLFPGYVFVRFSLPERVSVLNTPGVARIVGFGGVPVPLEDQEVGNIRTALASNQALGPWPYLHAGDRVRIERGPLRGVEGILLHEKTGFRLVLGVEILRRSVAVEVDPEIVTPVRSTRTVTGA